jgi:hypothetical protein
VDAEPVEQHALLHAEGVLGAVAVLHHRRILAAPLVIEIARVLDLAKKRGDGGVQEQLSTFFKKRGLSPARQIVASSHS